MHQHAQPGPKPVLLVAAESIALASGCYESVADIVGDRALGHYEEGLRQYFAIRLRHRQQAAEAFESLRGQMAKRSSRELLAPPGPRAQLYRLARCVLEARSRGTRAIEEDLPWLAPDHAPHSYLAALARLRRELTPDEADILELRYARELNPDELAFVMDQPVETVVARLEQAATKARELVGAEPESRLGGLKGAFQEAFALAPHALGDSQPSEVRQALPAGTTIADRYVLQRRVGEGSFGDVYRALDADVPGHVVALKLLHKAATSEDARKSALRELRLIASVFHPSVVHFKDHGWYRDRLWFVMPWYEGETLEERITRKPLTRKQAYEIFRPLAQALATMHAAGIRHQDIKPENIFLARIAGGGSEHGGMLPVLIDLGVAAKEAEMIVAGTPLYFPPEIAAQYSGWEQRPGITSKADVFSLALSLRNALEPDSQEQVPGTAIEAFIAHRADCPPQGPKGREFRFLDGAFSRWLSKSPDERPSADEFCDELQLLTLPERVKARRRSVLRWAAPLGLGALIALSSITYEYLKKREEAQAAQLRAKVTETKLGRESARRMRLEESYQVSELTRQQLGDRLTQRDEEVDRLEGQLARSRRDQGEMVGRLHALAAEIEEVQRKRDALQHRMDSAEAKLAVTEGKLFNADQRNAFMKSELRESRSRMEAAETELEELRSRGRFLLAELDRARGEADTQIGRLAELEQALSRTRFDRDRLEEELARLRRTSESQPGGLQQQPNGDG